MFKTAHDLFRRGRREQGRALGRVEADDAGFGAGDGRARYANLYLDTGHGHVGWTMACGSGKLTADPRRRRRPEIDTTGLLYRN